MRFLKKISAWVRNKLSNFPTRISQSDQIKQRLLLFFKFIAWVLVFVVTWKSYQEAHKSSLAAHDANQISIEANKTAQIAVALGQRPYVVAKPLKFRANGKYFLPEKVNGKMALMVQLEISNKGNSVAKNIKLSDMTITNSLLGEDQISGKKILVVKPEKIAQGGVFALAPGDSYVVEFPIPVIDLLRFEDIKNRVESGNLSVPLPIEINYESDFLKGKTGESIILSPTREEIVYTSID